MNITTDPFFYLRHYLSLPRAAVMFALAFAMVNLSLLILRLAAGRMSLRYTPDTRALFIRDEMASLAERFFELLFSSTTILLFVSIYFIIEYFGIGGQRFQMFWTRYGSILLLFFILASIILNSIADRWLIPLNHMRKGERSSMRLIGMLYMLIIFAYIKFIYHDDNYDSIILYFLTLVLGRFIYFDTSLSGFKDAMKDALVSLPLILPALMCTGMMALYGFSSGYLLTSNGVVFSLFIAHLFLMLAVAIVQSAANAHRSSSRSR